jgi:uncharacterized protein (DUF362 family)
MVNNTSRIGCASINSKTDKGKEQVLSAVSKAMDLANWDSYLIKKTKSGASKKRVFIKVNLLSHQVVPGHCTSPWILEGVLKKLRDDGNFDVFVGDANVATIKQVDVGSVNWGYVDICKKYGAKFVNLSKEPIVKRKFNGKIFDAMYLPKILTEVDYIITLPVPKTHNVSIMTCSLKNQWGCIPTFRHQYHDRVHKAIAEINFALKPVFVVCDATICSEGEGPRTSIPKVCDYVFASKNLVAMDSFIADFMGLDKKAVEHIYWSEKIGLGSSQYSLIGNTKGLLKNGRVVSRNFQKAVQKNHPIVFLEMKLRKIPVISYLLFKTFLFKIPAWIASRYNSIYWFNKNGKYLAQKIVKKYPSYREEFGQLIKDQKSI